MHSSTRTRSSVFVLATWAAVTFGLDPTVHAAENRWAFLGGFAAGFVLHESAHVGLGASFGAHPEFHRIDFGPIPFVAIGHDAGLPRRRESLISAAGFVSQHVSSEWIFSRHDDLRGEQAAFAKGALAFHGVTSLGYAVAAGLRRGPVERDTRSLAASVSLNERVVGALVIAPAAFDAWRYFRPRSRAARWGSRASKAAFLGVALFAK